MTSSTSIFPERASGKVVNRASIFPERASGKVVNRASTYPERASGKVVNRASIFPERASGKVVNRANIFPERASGKVVNRASIFPERELSIAVASIQLHPLHHLQKQQRLRPILTNGFIIYTLVEQLTFVIDTMIMVIDLKISISVNSQHTAVSHSIMGTITYRFKNEEFQ